MKIVNTYKPGSKTLQDDPSAVFSNNSPQVFLLRHGQIQGHGTRRFIGQTDVSLDETGRTQALFWKNAFASICFEKIYSSSLLRCQETSRLISPGKEICMDARLNEINLGEWDEKSFDHIRETVPDLFKQRGENISSFRPPGGESFNDLYNRVFPFFESLCRDLRNPVLVITHSGVIRVMLCHYLGLDLGQLLTIKPGYGQLFLLESK